VSTGLTRGPATGGGFVSLLAANLLRPVILATGCLVGLFLDLGDFLVYQPAMVLCLLLYVFEVGHTATLAPPTSHRFLVKETGDDIDDQSDNYRSIQVGEHRVGQSDPPY
jgi:hypothetical protein